MERCPERLEQLLDRQTRTICVQVDTCLAGGTVRFNLVRKVDQETDRTRKVERPHTALLNAMVRVVAIVAHVLFSDLLNEVVRTYTSARKFAGQGPDGTSRAGSEFRLSQP